MVNILILFSCDLPTIEVIHVHTLLTCYFAIAMNLIVNIIKLKLLILSLHFIIGNIHA